MMRPFKSLMEILWTGISGEFDCGHQIGVMLSQKHRRRERRSWRSTRAFEFALGEGEVFRPETADDRHQSAKDLRFYVLIREDDAAAKLADLKGKSISVPRPFRANTVTCSSKRRWRVRWSKPKKEFFNKVLTPFSSEEAVDAVVNGQVSMRHWPIAVSSTGTRSRSGPLRQAGWSRSRRVFPATVIAYHVSSLDRSERMHAASVKACSPPRTIRAGCS